MPSWQVLDKWGRIKGAGSVASSTQYITPAGLASLEAFGAVALTQFLAPSAIASGQAFGVGVFDDFLNAAGIASVGAFGTPHVYGPILPAGLASAEAFGTASLTNLLKPAGLASAETFGTASLLEHDFITPASIASTGAFGTASLDIGPTVTGPTALTVQVGSTITFNAGHGTAITVADPDTVTVQFAFSVSGGTITLATTAGLTITSGSGTNSHAMQSHGDISSINAALNGAVYTPPAGYVGSDDPSFSFSDLICGLVVLAVNVTVVGVIPSGIASAQAFGTASVGGGVGGSGIASAGAFGTASLTSSPAYLFNDTFTGTTGAAYESHTPDTGTALTVSQTGKWTIQSNALKATTNYNPDQVYARHQYTGHADVTMECKITIPATGGFFFALDFRCNAASGVSGGWHYEVGRDANDGRNIQNAGGSARLRFSKDNDAVTHASASTLTAGSTFSLKIVLSGNTFTSYFDTGSGYVQDVTFTDSTYNTQTYHGLEMYYDATGTYNASAIIDDLKIY